MTSGFDVKVKQSGPFFDKRDPIVRDSIKQTVENLVQVGEQRLDQILRPRPAGVFLSFDEAQSGQASTGNYRRNVHGEVKSYMFLRSESFGRIHDSGVVYGPWLEGTSRRNQTTRFKGYRAFRNTKDWLDRTQAQRIMDKHADRLRRRLDGDVL